MKLLDMSYRRWMTGLSFVAGIVALSAISVAQQQPQLGIAAVTYADIGSNAIIRQVTDITFDAQCLIWDEPLPGLLTVTPAPDVELDLYWLQMQ